MSARRWRRRSALTALGLASALSLGVALGAPADVDRTFGRDGRATADAGGRDFANAIALQPDGRIVVAGYTTLNRDAVAIRLNPDGSPDRSFDGDGVRTIDSGGFELAFAVALQPDGGIVLTGERSNGPNADASVYRLSSAGAPDPGFGTDGVQVLDAGGEERAYAAALQPDGRIVVAGYSLGGRNAMVWRLRPSGAPDPTFGTGGARAIDLGGTTEIARAVAVQPDGKIVVAGHATLNDVSYALAVRLTPTGAPDLSFGGGDSIATLGAGDRAHALAIQPDGRIVMAGQTELNFDATVYRLTADGVPDPGFGTGGIARIVGGGGERADALALQPDGKILVGGRTSAGDDALVYRLRPDGSRDAGFGDNGGLILGGSGLEEAQALALQADGKIVLAGDNDATNTDVLVYRLLGDSQITGPAGPRGGPIARPNPVARCAGKRATITGTPWRDRIRGSRGPDVIVALGGNDVIRGLSGNDLICAGAGDDVVFGGRGRDRLLGGTGRDRLVGGAGLDRLIGGPGRDTVTQ